MDANLRRLVISYKLFSPLFQWAQVQGSIWFYPIHCNGLALKFNILFIVKEENHFFAMDRLNYIIHLK